VPTQTCPAGAVVEANGDDSPGTRRRFFDWLRKQL